MNNTYRKLKAQERTQLIEQGCTADDWSTIEVCGEFTPNQIRNCGFKGNIRIEGNVLIRNVGTLSGYNICNGACIENTNTLETTGKSSFGNGVQATVINEGGGREVPLFNRLSAQFAYIMALYRHREATIGKLLDIILQEIPNEQIGTICSGARIMGCGIIRDVHIGADALLEGVSFCSNGTVYSHAGQHTYLGAGVKLRDFIVCGNSIVNNGTVAERCFFGNATHASALTATDSLFFANSHCDNGEVCSVLAGPYTISHHKSTLLIAGMFSFFNAGSGTNQSNHLLKSGPVHQGIHQRGCKYGSDAYMMLPALDGAFTTVIGRHKSHPDTESFPFSILIENEGQSWLLPGNNLTAYGTMRDISKWQQRDKRDNHSPDILHFTECNPYIAERIGRAIDLSEELTSKEHGEVIIHKRIRMKSAMLRRGLKLYRLAMEKYLGGILNTGAQPDMCGAGSWIDAAGMYLPATVMERILEQVDSGKIDSTDAIEEALREAAYHYNEYAAGWAHDRLEKLLGHKPSAEEIRNAIEAGNVAAEKLAAMAAEDLRSEQSDSMSIGYGLDVQDNETKYEDFRAVRRL